MYENIAQEMPLSSLMDMEEAFDAATAACNENTRQGGFSIYSRVFGKNLRLPELYPGSL